MLKLMILKSMIVLFSPASWIVATHTISLDFLEESLPT